MHYTFLYLLLILHTLSDDSLQLPYLLRVQNRPEGIHSTHLYLSRVLHD